MISSHLMHWDFALILIFLATAVPLLGRRRIRRLMAMPETTKRDRLTLYASTVAFQWLAAVVVLWRTRAHEILPTRLGLAIPNPTLTAIVAAILAVVVLTNQLVSLRRLASRPSDARGVLPQLALKIFPQDFTERLVFFALVVTVATCEELIFRGFVQRVFQDWCRGMLIAGILGSAVLFSVAHLYQGRRGVIMTFVVGLLFSAIRASTGSLLAPLIGHFVADISAGYLAPSRIRAVLARSASSAAGSKIGSDG